MRMVEQSVLNLRSQAFIEATRSHLLVGNNDVSRNTLQKNLCAGSLGPGLRGDWRRRVEASIPGER